MVTLLAWIGRTSMRLPMLRFFRPLVVILTLLIILIGVPISAQRIANASAYHCVQAIGQESTNFGIQNRSSTVLDVQRGNVSRTTRPTLPPDNWPSPDRRYTLFWWKFSAQETGLYLASTTSHFSTLVYKLPYMEYTNANFSWSRTPAWKWSPDSRQLSFPSISNNQYIVTIMDVETLSTRNLALPVSPDPDYPGIYNYGWSADQKYLAVGVDSSNTKAFFVWSTENDMLISPGIPLVYSQYNHYENNWAPTGHKLVLYYVDEATASTQVGIWSPENGMEVRASWEAQNQFVFLEWSPDGSQISAHEFGGHGADPTATTETTLISWTSDNSAIMHYWLASSDKVDSELRRINLSNGIDQILATEIFDITQSPDSRHFAYIVQSQSSDKLTTFTAYSADSDGNNTTEFWTNAHESDVGLGFFRRNDGYNQSDHNIFWSKDGNYVGIVVNRLGSFTTVIANMNGTIRKEIPSEFVYWAAGDWFYYEEAKTDTQVSLSFVNVVTGDTFKLTDLALDQNGASAYVLAVSPDRRMLLSSRDFKSFTITAFDTQEVYQWATGPLNITYQSFQHYGAGFTNYPDWNEHIFAWSPDSIKCTPESRHKNRVFISG
jgi:hypothetical protein